MNKIDLFWKRLEAKANEKVDQLNKLTQHTHRAVRTFNGYSVQAFSQYTNKWYHIVTVDKL